MVVALASDAGSGRTTVLSSASVRKAHYGMNIGMSPRKRMMKILYKGKDGGSESTVTGYWLIEWKPVFSIALLRLDDGSREAYHSHAFNAVSWLLSGRLIEEIICEDGSWGTRLYNPSIKPILTPRECFHKVTSVGRSWAITFRGPWNKTWKEYLPLENRHRTLTNGRKEIPILP